MSFLFLWGLVSSILFVNFRNNLVSAFDEQLKARASIVAQKTSTDPKIVPLPQGEESFIIIYESGGIPDTLYKPPVLQFNISNKKDSVITSNGWRIIISKQAIETGGYLSVIYALPSATIDKRIKQLFLLIILVLLVGCLFAIVLAYWLSSRLLKPVRQIINLSNTINFNQPIELLKEPYTKDELKELIVSFNRMLERIKDQSLRQTAFFASASHELRTPLSLMQTRLQVQMQAPGLNPEVKVEYAEQVKQVQRLIKMANDFLLLSELKSGSVQLLLSECNLSEKVTETISTYKNKAVEKNIQFKIIYRPVEAAYGIMADDDKLEIILSNLIDNAIKYSPVNSTIKVLLEAKENNILFTISNRIRDEINPQVKDVKNEFYHSKPLHGEGFGLGLWIAGQLAALQKFELYFTITEKSNFEASLLMAGHND